MHKTGPEKRLEKQRNVDRSLVVVGKVKTGIAIGRDRFCQG